MSALSPTCPRDPSTIREVRDETSPAACLHVSLQYTATHTEPRLEILVAGPMVATSTWHQCPLASQHGLRKFKELGADARYGVRSFSLLTALALRAEGLLVFELQGMPGWPGREHERKSVGRALRRQLEGSSIAKHRDQRVELMPGVDISLQLHVPNTNSALASFYQWLWNRTAEPRTEEEWERLRRMVVPMHSVPVSADAAGPAYNPTAVADQLAFKYRDNALSPAADSSEAATALAGRYGLEPIRFGTKVFPATILWSNPGRSIDPDAILGELDKTPTRRRESFAGFSEEQYSAARAFVESKLKTALHPHDGRNYVLDRLSIDATTGVPRLTGRFGLYYDNILTQYAVEWELRRLAAASPDFLARIAVPNTLPLREHVEDLSAGAGVFSSGAGRSASLTVSTLLLFDVPGPGLCGLITRRSSKVAVSPGMLHVVPAGMFEAPNTLVPWSVRRNIWRELLEELYDDEEQCGTDGDRLDEDNLNRPPVDTIHRLLEDGSAEIVVTGLCGDLLSLRVEICTLLLIQSPLFLRARRMKLNWESEPGAAEGLGIVPVSQLEGLIERSVETPGVAPGCAAAVRLGLDWVRGSGRLPGL